LDEASGCRPRGEESFVTDTGTGSTDVESTRDSGGTAAQVKDQVREKAQVAQDKARGAASQARGRISDQVDQRSTQAGERVAGTASDVRSIAEELRDQGKDAPANLAEQVANQADRVSDYLKGASGDRILRDVEDFARRQPMLVAAAGLTLGFAASRFLKASSSHRYQSDPDLLYVEAQPYDAGAATATAFTSDPAYTGSDHATETPFTQADVVSPATGSDPSATQAMTPVTELTDPSDSRREEPRR
jgi:hypothetical protein